MGISTYYEVVPKPLLDELADDDEMCAAFECLWGSGSGMYSWFQEIPEEEIVLITSAREIEAPGIDRLRQLLSKSQSFPSAYIEKTHFEHESMLKAAFESLHVPDLKHLVKNILYGEREWGADSVFSITTPERCSKLCNYLKRLNLPEVVQAFDLGPREPPELWRECLLSELRQLVDCHCTAAEGGHYVLLGTT